MTRKKRIIISAGFGLLAMILSGVYLKGKESEILRRGESVPVVVAEEDIPEGSKLDRSLLKIISLPHQYRQPEALTDVKEVEGLVTEVPIKKGEQVLLTKLSVLGLKGALSASVPVGMRAVSISVDEMSGVSGLIKPGDFVDVLATFDFGADTGSKKYTYTLFQNIEVLSVGQEVDTSGIEQKSPAPFKKGIFGKGMAEPFGGKKVDSTITLALGPSDTQKLVLAEESGNLYLSLRNRYDDGKVLGPEPSTPFSITRLESLLRPKARPSYREYRGR